MAIFPIIRQDINLKGSRWNGHSSREGLQSTSKVSCGETVEAREVSQSEAVSPARQCILMARVYIRAPGQCSDTRRLLQLRSPVPCVSEGISTRQSQDR